MPETRPERPDMRFEPRPEKRAENRPDIRSERPEAQTHSYEDIDRHPDLAEIRERHDRILGGPQAVAVDGLVLLVGLYTAISPWAVNGFQFHQRLTLNNVIVGLAVALIGMVLTLAPQRAHRLAWTLVPIGIWQIITPWVIGPHIRHTVWNNVVTGAIMTLLGLAAAFLMMTAMRSGRGSGRGRRGHDVASAGHDEVVDTETRQ